jgi:hypothetical protein
MATYTEIREVYGNGPLMNKTEVAVVIKAYTILQEETPSVARVDWASATLASSRPQAEKLLKYALAANKTLTKQQLLDASDAALQEAIDAAVDAIYK